MSAFATQNAEWYQEIQHSLAQWNPEDPPAAGWFTHAVQERLGAGFVGTYQPAVTDRGWEVAWMVGSGETAPMHIRAFGDYVARLPDPDRFLAYDPFWVDPAERNHSFTLRKLPRDIIVEQNETILRQVGSPGHDMMRVLVCDGPRLLGWLGATRSEPFSHQEIALFRRLVPSFRQRLRLERRLRPAAHRAAVLDAVLEALDVAAFVIGPRRSIEAANARATAWFDRDPRGVRAALSDSQGGPPEAAIFSIVPLVVKGCPAHVLALEKRVGPTIGYRACSSARRWSLTPRQARVLDLILEGRSNKEIAAALGCATITVENHLTQIYRRSGARSRIDLVRRVFSSPG